MQNVHDDISQGKRCSERFQAHLRYFLAALEAEWRQSYRFMDLPSRELFQAAHRSLGELQDEVG